MNAMKLCIWLCISDFQTWDDRAFGENVVSPPSARRWTERSSIHSTCLYCINKSRSTNCDKRYFVNCSHHGRYKIKLLRANGASKENNLMHEIWVPSYSQRSEQYGSCDQGQFVVGSIGCDHHQLVRDLIPLLLWEISFSDHIALCPKQTFAAW